ncbi:MAG: signal peptide peptidase SppA [Pirellulales bacterium]|nr:signal peptide peptidase SppA [Pirellulales bacterium]
MDTVPTQEGSPQSPFVAQIVDRPAPPPRRGSRVFRTLLLLAFLVVLAGSLFLNLILIPGGWSGLSGGKKVREEYFSHERLARDKVAILTVSGVILDGEGFVKRQIDHAMADDNLKALVLRVDSPGGTVSGSDFILHHLRKLARQRGIPVVVSMGSVAASGGYYVSMVVGDTPETIFAEPTTWTGSIGVKIPHYDLSELLAGWGVKEDTIASHRLKTMGSLAKPLSEEERKIFQSLVDDSFARFKKIVREGRPKFDADPKALDALATGQIFDAEQALESGLVDRIGFVEEAVDRAIELAGLDPEDVLVVKYKREPSLATMLIGEEARGAASEWQTLVEMTTPRAYYLATWLPSALATD